MDVGKWVIGDLHCLPAAITRVLVPGSRPVPGNPFPLIPCGDQIKLYYDQPWAHILLKYIKPDYCFLPPRARMPV